MAELHPAVAEFGDWLAGRYRADALYDQVLLLTGPEASPAELRACLRIGRSAYEVRVCLAAGELQAGFATESRVINESIEQMILDNGGDLSDLLGDELCDLGETPLPMEHFFERPAFRYTVRLPLGGPEELADPALRNRVAAVLRASRILFQDSVDAP